MRTLVTGATGKVGHATARTLLAAGLDVRALVRDPSRAVVPDGVEVVRGDVTAPDTLRAACEGCEIVFNAMGLPEQWLADASLFERVNVDGTRNVVGAAIAAGARRVVHTSTIDVFDADAHGVLRETQLATRPKGTAYERSKQRAEVAAIEAAGDAIELVMVNPAAVYGPGPMGSASTEEAFIRPVVLGRRREVPFAPPGGLGMVFSDGIGAGQLLAAERGVPGERYILCDGGLTMVELAELAVRVAGRGVVPPAMPVVVAEAIAVLGAAVARVTRRPPLLPRGQLTFLRWNARPDASKAQRELGWTPTPLEEGMRRTLEDLGLV